MPAFRIDPVVLDTDSGDEDARLVYIDNKLAAILVCLSELHGPDEGSWFVEMHFPTGGRNGGTFATIEEALSWLTVARERAN
jgi:hypothetical protein